jgi:hypothetical protein
MTVYIGYDQTGFVVVDPQQVNWVLVVQSDETICNKEVDLRSLLGEEHSGVECDDSRITR